VLDFGVLLVFLLGCVCWLVGLFVLGGCVFLFYCDEWCGFVCVAVWFGWIELDPAFLCG